MTTEEVILELQKAGNEGIKKIYLRHGAREPFFGVKIEYLKTIQKRVKRDYKLSMDLYRTGISDAMYLAGLIADESKMSKADIQAWADKAYWHMLSLYTVPWVASESAYGWELAMEWIEKDDEQLETAGWATLASLLSVKKDEEIDIQLIDRLLDRVLKDIHQSKNYVRYAMNGFVIAVGSYIEVLSDKAMEVGKKIGKVHVDMGDTACNVPYSPDYIWKVVTKGKLGKKRKTAKC